MFQIQKLVISGGNFKPDTLKPKEVVSLLLDDEEIEQKCKCSYNGRWILDQICEEVSLKYSWCMTQTNVVNSAVMCYSDRLSKSGMINIFPVIFKVQQKL